MTDMVAERLKAAALRKKCTGCGEEDQIELIGWGGGKPPVFRCRFCRVVFNTVMQEAKYGPYREVAERIREARKP